MSQDGESPAQVQSILGSNERVWGNQIPETLSMQIPKMHELRELNHGDRGLLLCLRVP